MPSVLDRSSEQEAFHLGAFDLAVGFVRTCEWKPRRGHRGKWVIPSLG